LGGCLLLAVFQKLQKKGKILDYFLPDIPVTYLFWQQWIGLHFGRLFHKHIWSPWLIAQTLLLLFHLNILPKLSSQTKNNDPVVQKSIFHA
jgi:hypothetical protein